MNSRSVLFADEVFAEHRALARSPSFHLLFPASDWYPSTTGVPCTPCYFTQAMLELEVASKDAAGFLNVSSSNCHPSALKQVDPLADVRSCPWDEALEAALRVTLGTLIVSLGFPYVINIRSTSLCNGRYFDRVFVALKMGKDTYDLKEVFIRKLRNLRDKLHRPSSMLVYVLCLFIGSYGGLRKAIKVFFLRWSKDSR